MIQLASKLKMRKPKAQKELRRFTKDQKLKLVFLSDIAYHERDVKQFARAYRRRAD